MTKRPPLDISESQRLYAEACNFVVGGTTQSKRPDLYIEGEYPIYASRGSGAYVWDVDGNRYLDWVQSLGIVILGHADPDVDEAAIREIREGFAFSMSKPVQNELARMLVDIIPCAELVHLFKVGSDSTSVAVRLARIYTGRNKVIRWGYNGWHDWCCHFDAGITSGVREDVFTLEYNDLASLERQFAENRDQVACVFMMPFETAAPAPDYLAGVRQLAHDNGALFILDEMRSGFRFAMGGAQEHYGVVPDMATFGKALSNGYAISALAGRADIMESIHQTHVSSGYAANSAAIAASVACIGKLQQDDILPHIWRLGQGLIDGLNTLARDTGVEAEAVGFAPMPDLVFRYDSEDRINAAKRAFYSTAIRAGVLLHPNHHWYVSAAHTDEDLTQTLNICDEAFRAVRKTVG